MARHSRPRRGPAGPNVLVTGDTGLYGGPQGGARDVEREGPGVSGDLASREFGVPQADIPGGVRHLVNPQTHVDSPGPKVPRPADYHKEHGVEPLDWGQYVLPPDESEHYAAERPAPEPRWLDAVPVYQVSSPQAAHRIRTLYSEGPVVVAAATVDPIRLATRDPERVKFWICVETQPLSGGQVTGEGTVTNPAAGNIIAVITAAQLAAVAPAGTIWQVSWQVSLQGTVTAADANNMVLASPLGTNQEIALYPGVVGEYPQEPVVLQVNAGANISVKAIANSSGASAIYGAQLSAVPLQGTGIRIGDFETCADGRGLLVPAGQLKDFNTQDSVYCTNQSAGPVTLSWGYETEAPAAEAGFP